jgi:hypothetical protein
MAALQVAPILTKELAICMMTNVLLITITILLVNAGFTMIHLLLSQLTCAARAVVVILLRTS